MDVSEKILLRGCVISDISQPDAFDNKLLHSLNIKEGRKKKKIFQFLLVCHLGPEGASVQPNFFFANKYIL